MYFCPPPKKKKKRRGNYPEGAAPAHDVVTYNRNTTTPHNKIIGLNSSCRTVIIPPSLLFTTFFRAFDMQADIYTPKLLGKCRDRRTGSLAFFLSGFRFRLSLSVSVSCFFLWGWEDRSGAVRPGYGSTYLSFIPRCWRCDYGVFWLVTAEVSMDVLGRKFGDLGELGNGIGGGQDFWVWARMVLCFGDLVKT